MVCVIIYHIHCNDGIAAASIVRSYAKSQGMQYILIGIHPNEHVNHSSIGDSIICVDVLPKNYLELKQTAREFIIVDHHESNRHAITENDIFEMEHSAVALAWHLFNQGSLPMIFQYVEDRDLWNNRINYSAEVMAAFNHRYKHDEEKMDAFDDLCYNPSSRYDLVREGITLMKKIHCRVVEASQSAYPAQMSNYSVIIYHNIAPDILNELADYTLKNKYTDVVMFIRDTQSQYIVSLRSNDYHPSVLPIASINGGGGHRNAAAFCINKYKTKSDVYEMLNIKMIIC